MATFDQMIIDDRDLANRYFGENNFDELDDDHFLLTNNQQAFHTKQDPTNTNDDDNLGLFGRRVYLESPALGNKEEEDLYRYVPSRLSEHPGNVIGQSVPAPTGGVLIDSLDFELDMLGATNTRPTVPYRSNPQLFQETKPPAPLTQITNPLTPMTSMRRADPRQDPLLGPLLAELDAMSTQQQRLAQAPAEPPPVQRRNSVPYEPNHMRPPVPSQSNNALTTANNRTLNDALLEAELYDSLETRDQQIHPVQKHQSSPFSAPNINSSNHSQQQQQQQQRQQQPQPNLHNRQSNMNSTDIFMPSSYNTEPVSFVDNFGPDDQLFQQPLLNAIGQNYVSNQRPPPPPSQQQPKHHQQVQPNEEREPSFDNSRARLSPSYRLAHASPPHPPINDNPYYSQQTPAQLPPPPANRQLPYTDDRDPFNEYHEMFAPSQHQRPPQSQQRTVPLPPLGPQQPRYQRSLPPSQQQQQRQYFDEPAQPNNQEMFFTDNNDDQLEQFSYPQMSTQQPPPPPPMSNSRNFDPQNDQDTKRQAIWNDLQRTNAKVQEKNAKKRESANRRDQLLKGNYGSSNNLWSNSKQSSAQSKTNGQSPLQQRRRPPAVPVSKTNYIDENIDMIKNKENFYHRYPAKKYENLYSKRKDLQGDGNSNRNNDPNQDSNLDYDQTQSSTGINNTVATYAPLQHRSSLPVNINLNPDESARNGNHPGTMAVPLDSHVTRSGDKISVNIDLRLVDLQNFKNQQNSEHPDWSGLDPLDRHIRRLERSIDQSLPQTNSPTQRTPTLVNPQVNTTMGRYGKSTTGAARNTHSPPNYGKEYFGYGDKKDDSYLSKMHHAKQGPHFKAYSGQDYEQFKKNYGFGNGYLGFDFDNPNYKEKSDKLTKTKEYAQQIEARNKKKLAEAPRRTLSDTRIPTETSKTQRALDYARTSTRHKPSSGTSTHSTPPEVNRAPPRRPTETINNRPSMQKQTSKYAQNDDSELVERLALRHERDKAQVQGILNPSQKRREVFFDDDDRRASDIERMAQDRANQRRLSPPRQLPPAGPTNAGNARRPLRFDKPLIADEPSHEPSSPPQQAQVRQVRQSQLPPQQRSIIRHESQQPETNVDELANRHHDEKMLMEAIRQELSERPLADDEELIVVEQ